MGIEYPATTELIEEFEYTRGLKFDSNGPQTFCRCEHCEALIQYIPDHSCSGTEAENGAAAWFEDASYGTDY